MTDAPKRPGRPRGRSPNAKMKRSVYLLPDTWAGVQEDSRSPDEIMQAGLAATGDKRQGR